MLVCHLFLQIAQPAVRLRVATRRILLRHLLLYTLRSEPMSRMSSAIR